MSYSNSGGGTLTLPSPTHVHHVDVTSAVRSLRRSLSRSPSKFRLVTKSPSPSPKSPLSPSPLSPPKRAVTSPSILSTNSVNPPHTPSPLAVPFPPSAKLALRSSSRTKAAPCRPVSRTRSSPKSPMKRALSSSIENGNSLPSGLTMTAGGQENNPNLSSPVEQKSLERASSRILSSADAQPHPVNNAISRLGGDASTENPTGSQVSSPLKRSDAIMNLDQASLGSPVAKRRSLHGSANFGHDFNVFDPSTAPASTLDIHDDSNHEYELSSASIAIDNSTFTSLPRRSSSLRKSTLQQRHGEKTSWGRRHAAQLLAAQQAAAAAASNTVTEVSTPNAMKNRPRLSLDQFMPPIPRDSLFSSSGGLPSASIHPLSQPTQQPHPLSRTMTTSSSGSSIVDESPTHIPATAQFGHQSRPKLDFSKSLPAGALRPFSFDAQPSEDRSFATPPNYKSVKPLPSAFASTGLISKVNRNPEEPQMVRGSHKNNVPDTPCKKHFNGFATYPAPVPGSAIAKARHIRHSFGTPSTPFNPHGNPVSGAFSRGTGVFGSAFGDRVPNRRESFLSVDGDEITSPELKGDSQSTADFELPPTPTKQVIVMQPDHGSPSSHRSVPGAAGGLGLMRRLPRHSSKLNLFTSSHEPEAEESDGSTDMNDSPTLAHCRAGLRFRDTVPTFGQSLTRRELSRQSPTPSISKSHSTAATNAAVSSSFLTCIPKPGFAKFSHVAPASPLERIEFIERLSPHTPPDGIAPPDPSGLSISNHRDGQVMKAVPVSMPPPATPRTGRDYFSVAAEARRLSTTPVSTFAQPEIDESLTSRFGKVEMIGTGEFSQVFRVIQMAISLPSHNSESPPTSTPDQVFAVKKSRQPYQGTRDRQRKLQEVNVLKALGQSDHVVHLIDSWEEKNYLYIQTEFCEEGSMDLFLSQVGRKGRLDDFRIWKIMLELSQGLQHIHDSGFIHLDLKPANVLITFEGVLKIADFGIATSWPAQPGIEGEGDREYIGPEILEGNYDKPADIFALGLIMLEIAGNVQLPDNGPTWQRLRSGDISDVPSLTWSSDNQIYRDATGIPLDDSEMNLDSFGSDDEIEIDFGSPSTSSRKRSYGKSSRAFSHDPGNLFGSLRRGELHKAPPFMKDMYHQTSLDQLVRRMIMPNPQDRPMVHQVLESEGIRWVQARRRAGATVYEGNWGPADEVLADDTEMIDI